MVKDKLSMSTIQGDTLVGVDPLGANRQYIKFSYILLLHQKASGNEL